LKLDSNNNFISSISANGTLSLGAEVPENKNDYLIYAPGKSHIETLNVSNISTDNTDNIIVFGNANLSNINSIHTQSISIKNLTVDTITSTGAEFTNSSVNNIKFNEVTSDFLKYNNIYTYISNKLIVGELPPSHITQNSLLEINVNDSRKGLIIQNSTGSTYDPSLEILGEKTKPMMQLTHKLSDLRSSSMYIQYFNDPSPNGNDVFHFQIYSSETETPKVLNYCSSDNMLAIGGNAICINYDNLINYRITLGIRDPPSVFSQTEENEYLHKTFLQHKYNEEDVAIYGNLKIATKQNDTLIETNQTGNVIFHTENILFKKEGNFLSLTELITSIMEDTIDTVSEYQTTSIKNILNTLLTEDEDIQNTIRNTVNPPV